VGGSSSAHEVDGRRGGPLPTHLVVGGISRAAADDDGVGGIEMLIQYGEQRRMRVSMRRIGPAASFSMPVAASR
jgi:hypothetical protein